MFLFLRPLRPLAVGETDWRAFDFTKDVGGEMPSNPRVICTWSASAAAGNDPSPQARVGGVSIVNSLTQIVGPQNQSVTRAGTFLLFYLGPPPPGAAGGAYLVQGLIDTPTRSALSLSAQQPVSAT